MKRFIIFLLACLCLGANTAQAAPTDPPVLENLRVNATRAQVDWTTQSDPNSYYNMVSCRFEIFNADDSYHAYANQFTNISSGGRCVSVLPLDVPRNETLTIKVDVEFSYRAPLGGGFYSDDRSHLLESAQVVVPTNLNPQVSNIRLDGKQLVADVVDDGGVKSCSFVVSEAGYSQNVSAEYYDQTDSATESGIAYSNVCISDFIEDTAPEGALNAEVTATDDLNLETTVSDSFAWAYKKPVVSNVSVVSNRYLLADVSDDYLDNRKFGGSFYNSIESCEFALTNGSTTEIVAGDFQSNWYNDWMVCTAKLPEGLHGTFDIEARATDKSGSDYNNQKTGTIVKNNVVIIDAPDVGAVSFPGDELVADVLTLSPTTNSCQFSVFYTYYEAPLSSIGSGGVLSFATPAAGLANSKHKYVEIDGTYNASTNQCTAPVPDEVRYPDASVSGGEPFYVLGYFMGANYAGVLPANQAPTVSNVELTNRTLQADADDSDGFVESCTIRILKGNYDVTVPGAYNPATKKCSASLPAAAPHGNLAITVTAVDNEGATGADSNTVTNPNQAPVVSNIRYDGVIRADAEDKDGTITACRFVLSQGAFSIERDGTYDAASKECRLAWPESAPKNLSVTVTATDNDGDKGTATGPVSKANLAPVVSSVRLEQGFIKAKAEDQDGTIAACSFDVAKGDYAKTLVGSYDEASKTCSVLFPVDAPHGDLNVVAHATDNDGAKGSDTGSIKNANQPPVVSNIKVENGVITATATDPDGIIVSCSMILKSGDYQKTVPGTYDAASKICKAVVPNDAPTEFDVTVIAVDNDNEPGSGAGALSDFTSSNKEALACSSGRIVVTNLRVVGSKAVLTGIAPISFAGKEVTVTSKFSKKLKARAKVDAKGNFIVKAPLPAKKLIGSNKAFYRAEVNGQKSKYLKLTRYLSVSKMEAQAGKTVRVEGLVEKKYPGQKVDVMVAYDCGKGKVLSSMKVDGKGKFKGTVRLSTNSNVVNIRLRVKAKNKKTSFYTYSITQPVVLKK